MKTDVFSAESFIVKPIAELPKSGIREFFDLVAGRSDVISLGVGEPDFTTPWNVRETAIYSLESGHTSYTSNAGLPALRKAITEYLRSDYNLNYDPASECLVTIGVSAALSHQMGYLVPALTVLGIAASVSLRRKGFAKSGFAVQFIGPAVMGLILLADLPNAIF